MADLLDKYKYVIHVRNLKQAFNHGLVLKKFYENIKYKKESG